jgi:uncharacterized protein (TIGR00375 family)
MEIISDLHIHSRFSRATSNDLSIKTLEKWARVKGINLLGTGDFCHPKWIKELKQELHEESGILKTKDGFNFILSNEISLMYTQGKGRRVHLVFLAPDFKTVERITEYLGKKGRLDYDGRPIFNISCEKLAEDFMAIDERIEIIPAHAWTPWFGVFGSDTGFDSMNEAFGNQVKNIHSFETGMSSDPEMNWRLKQLDKYSVLSFSDSHSYWPWRLGREASVFDMNEINYENLIKAIRQKNVKYTIETSPSYGKYHFDGHRLCKFSCSPEESLRLKGICPVCKKSLTIGVLNRVEKLADRKEGEKPKEAKPFKILLPLHEVLAARIGMAMTTKKVWQQYNLLIDKFNTEFNILLNASFEDLTKVVDENIAKDILRNRFGKIHVVPGFDGEYGVPVLDIDKEKQKKLI